MLIIAIPKSASTSLLKTLSTLHDLKGIQDFSFNKNSYPENSIIIHTLHSDIRELNKSLVKKFYDDNKIFKQHIFPSKNNLALLQNKKKVILLRNPDDILKSYLRGAKYNFNSLPEGFNLKMTKKEFIKKAKKYGLYNDIDYFYSGWSSLAPNEYTLFVQYQDYIKNTKSVVNEIEEFIGLPITKSEIKPIKARYAKIGLVKKIKAHLRIYSVEVLRKIGLN